MSPLFVLIFVCHLTCTIRADETSHITRHLLAGVNIPPQNDAPNSNTDESNKKESPVVIKIDSKKKNNEVQSKPPESKTPIEKKSTSQAPAAKNATKVEEHQVLKTTEMESGALLRGVSVIVALTTLVIIYMALKTYCGKRGRHPVMVSKYGVRTRRSDIEMTPLPLEEDEEDETLFDVNSTNR